jgi:hypothetical protein
VDAWWSAEALRKVHVATGHSNLQSLIRLLEIGNPDEPSSDDDVETLQAEIEACLICKPFGRPGRRQRGAVPHTPRLNAGVIIDVFFFHGLAALSIVDVSIVYCVARFMRKQTSEET